MLMMNLVFCIPHVEIVAVIFVFHHSKNLVIVPLSAQAPYHIVTVMKTFHIFLTILTSSIRSEDRQE